MKKTTWQGSNHFCFLTRTKDEEVVVGRYRFRGQGLSASDRSFLLCQLEVFNLCWTPFRWSSSDIKGRGLMMRAEHVPENENMESIRNRKYEEKTFPVEYYPYYAFSLRTVPYSIPTYTRCFKELHAAMVIAAKHKVYYLDFRADNVLSPCGYENWRCCDLDSCVMGDAKIPEDFQLSSPRAPELATFIHNKFALSIWQLGCMFFSLVSGKRLTLEPSSSSISSDQDDPFAFLLPTIKEETLSLEAFSGTYGHLPLGRLISLCLDRDPSSRSASFIKLQLTV